MIMAETPKPTKFDFDFDFDPDFDFDIDVTPSPLGLCLTHTGHRLEGDAILALIKDQGLCRIRALFIRGLRSFSQIFLF